MQIQSVFEVCSQLYWMSGKCVIFITPGYIVLQGKAGEYRAVVTAVQWETNLCRGGQKYPV